MHGQKNIKLLQHMKKSQNSWSKSEHTQENEWPVGIIQYRHQLGSKFHVAVGTGITCLKHSRLYSCHVLPLSNWGGYLNARAWFVKNLLFEQEGKIMK